MICGNRLTFREVADEVGISVVSCRHIFTEKLRLLRTSVNFVLRLLTDDQKENRVEISQDLLDNANGNENFLKNIIRGAETWVYGYDVETPRYSRRMDGERVSSTKQSMDESVKDLLMLVVFIDWEGIVHHELVPHGQMVSKQLYQEVLAL